MSSEMDLQLACFAILRLPTILEGKVFRICAILLSLSVVSSFSIKVSFSIDIILSGKIGLMVFHKVLLSLHCFKFYYLYFVFMRITPIQIFLFSAKRHKVVTLL